MTENASKLSLNIYEKCHNAMKQDRSHLAVKVILERAENALSALKRLESLCKSGISQHDYIGALGEANVAVNMFIEHNESNIFRNLKLSIIKTMQLYDNIYDYLMLSELEAGINRQQGRELDATQVAKKYEYLVGQSISDAENELETSFLLLHHCKLQHAPNIH